MQAPLQARNDADAVQTDTAKMARQERRLVDNRPTALVQCKLAEMMNASPRVLQQRARSDAIHNSSRMVTQRHEMNALFGGAGRPQGDGMLFARQDQQDVQSDSASDSDTPSQLKHTGLPADGSPTQPTPTSNHTGLPDQLKSGIESLSGLSMDTVRVHYNSAKPAQLQAHAYAQGHSIHVAPGQEKHLPHEAWHVVQQMQGRVPATMQAKGIAINDDASLEGEATLMGERALQLKDAPASGRPMQAAYHAHQPAQLARYLKCIQSPGNMAHEVARLEHASPLDNGTFGGNKPAQEGGMPVDMNQWLGGAAGLSMTHYNPGQIQYYSPVGFVVDVGPESVLGNYAGDGSTSTLHVARNEYWRTFEQIRQAMMAVGTPIRAAIDAAGLAAPFNNVVNNQATALTLKGHIEAFLANAGVAADARAAATALIRTETVAGLQRHYQDPTVVSHALGPGGPDVLAPLEAHLLGLAPGTGYFNATQNRENKYTESQVHAQIGHVVGAFYATAVGAYPGLIDPIWRAGDPNFLGNRANAAVDFNQLFIGAGNVLSQVMHLEGGHLIDGMAPAPAAPSGFYKWALVALGIGTLAALYGGQLSAMYAQYTAQNG